MSPSMQMKWNSSQSSQIIRSAGRHQERKRMNSFTRKLKGDKVRDANKKNNVQPKKNKASGGSEYYVYVGNIVPGTSEDDIKRFFSRCGNILRVIIRCSRGQGVTMSRISEELRRPCDTQYATVEFMDSRSVTLAVRLNGSSLDGSLLVVCPSPADLPELQDMIRSRVDDLEARNLAPGKVPKMRNRPIFRDDTEIIAGPTTLEKDHHRVDDERFSFVKCLV